MSKIALIAPGDSIAGYGRQLKEQLENPDDLEIVTAYFEDAVLVAKELVLNGTQIILAHGNSMGLLRKEGLPVPLVEIPLGYSEIALCIKKAIEISGKSRPRIAILGYDSIVPSVRSLLDIFDVEVFLYEIASMEYTQEKLERARRENIDVLIGGVKTCDLIRQAGMNAVLMEGSYDSVSEAFRRALEVLAAIELEKKKTQEKNTIFNAVSEAIVSIDDKHRITYINQFAERIFSRSSKEVAGENYAVFFRPSERDAIKRVLNIGEEDMSGILERPINKYVMSIVPIIVDTTVTGAVVTLQEIVMLQKMETAVRKGLYQKGNNARYTFDDIKGISPEIKETINIAQSYAKLRSNILIYGETGTGKELFAQSIHNVSSRRNGPFVAVNCGAIPASLRESELFGYVDGAFTGAKKGGHMGLFELAHSGTIFLDEIAELDLRGQIILLRILQEHQVRRVGGDTNIPVDVRIIAASNVNLHELVLQNKFRKDLYYRLSVLLMHIPPLRNRQGDVRTLSEYFIDYYRRKFGKQAILSSGAKRELEGYEWDGNIRQLKNLCERIMAITEEAVINGGYIHQQLEDSYYLHKGPQQNPGAIHTAQKATEYIEDSRDAIVIKGKILSKFQMKEILRAAKGNREMAARQLGVSRTTLWKHLKKIGLEIESAT